MNWEKLLSSQKIGNSPEHSPLAKGRTPFEADVDKVIFSGAFRRLNRKTQVHPLAANDHIHTRLTHSLEVAQVGRELGKAVGVMLAKELPKNRTPHDLGAILQAACLAHDIGNPPFGHAGEEAMGHWFEANGHRLFRALSKDHKRDLQTFEGNAQGFRIITQTENHLFTGGLQLTSATLATFLKYPWTSRNPDRKFGAYLSEEKILEEVAEHVGLHRSSKSRWCRHPLAHLVEAADDICYAILDLEDAVELKIIPYDAVQTTLLEHFDSKERSRIANTLVSRDSHRVNLARLRSPVFEFLINGTLEAFKRGYDAIMEGKVDHDVLQLLGDADPRRKLVAAAKELSRSETFRDPKKVETELGSYATFEHLLEAFCGAALDAAQHLESPKGEAAIAWKSQRILELLGDHAPSEKNAPIGSTWSQYQCLRRVIDYVSGMTDNYATYVSKQLQGMAFTGVQRP